jgi:hypothetical protein
MRKIHALRLELLMRPPDPETIYSTSLNYLNENPNVSLAWQAAPILAKRVREGVR